MNPSTRTDSIVGRRSGSVMRQKLWLALAPSIAALSYSSWGMVVSPVDSRIVLNGIPIHHTDIRRKQKFEDQSRDRHRDHPWDHEDPAHRSGEAEILI